MTTKNKEFSFVVVGLIVLMLYVVIKFIVEKNIIDLIYLFILVSLLYRFIYIKKIS